MNHPSLKYVGDKKLRELLDGYACRVPFHAVRTRFLGNIATPRHDIAPLDVMKELWDCEWPEFVDMEALNALLQDLTGLWNDLTRHQSGTKPFRLVRWAVVQGTVDLKRLCQTHTQQLEGFIEGLFGGEEIIDLPESASEALEHLREINAIMHGALDLIRTEPPPVRSSA